jgi:hypothetical protein
MLILGAGGLQDDTNTCIICFSPVTADGDHKLSALPCGHLFGFKCISNWLGRSVCTASGAIEIGAKCCRLNLYVYVRVQKKACPTCNRKFRAKHVIRLFADRVKPIDTTERETLLKQIEQERQKAKQSQQVEQQMRLVNEIKDAELLKLKQQIQQLTQLNQTIARTQSAASNSTAAGTTTTTSSSTHNTPQATPATSIAKAASCPAIQSTQSKTPIFVLQSVLEVQVCCVLLEGCHPLADTARARTWHRIVVERTPPGLLLRPVVPTDLDQRRPAVWSIESCTSSTHATRVRTAAQCTSETHCMLHQYSLAAAAIGCQ